jgi:hypothetical protein
LIHSERAGGLRFCGALVCRLDVRSTITWRASLWPRFGSVSGGIGVPTDVGIVHGGSCGVSGRKLGIALLDLGNYAKNQLGPALKETQHARLTAS